MEVASVSPTESWTENDGGRVGLWLFILSEVLLFGALLASYVSARIGSPECSLGVVAWPEAARGSSLLLAAINTVLLLTSSYAMVRAVGRAERGDRPGYRASLAAVLLLGGGFLVVKGVEYWLKISHGLYPGSALAAASPGLSIFLSYYYGLTILHALHVTAGLVWNGLLVEAWPAASKIRLAGLYWHFVDVVWVLLFPLLYLL